MNGKLLDTNVIIRYIKDEGNLDDIFEDGFEDILVVDECDGCEGCCKFEL